MSGSLVVPMSVAAKVTKTGMKVPELGGSPFNQDATLEPGVHVHWALPDFLTRAKLLTHSTVNQAVFPGVPDLWMVTRFNPAPEPNTTEPRRPWRAWIVDSRMQTVTPFETWKVPTAGRDAGSLHTVAGMLPSAAAIGHPGWGLQAANAPEFDVLLAAYYPEARKRFGLYDDLSDLAGVSGNVSYTVIGWYSIRENDPLYESANRKAQLKHWKLMAGDALLEIATPILAGQAPSSPGWSPAGMKVDDLAARTVEAVDEARRMASRGGTVQARMKQLSVMQDCITKGETASATATLGTVSASIGPAEIVCHGSVMEVSLAGAAASNPTLDLRVYPSIKRAMAAVANMKPASSAELDFTEMLLQDLDYQKPTVAGILDLPGSAHGLTFQGVAGKSRYFARIDIWPKLLPGLASAFSLTQQEGGSGHWPDMTLRSASITQNQAISNFPPEALRQPQFKLEGPATTELDTWRAEVRAAFDTAKKDAGDKSMDPRLVVVQDHRAKAQPLTLGTSPMGGGSDGAAWWIDILDDIALNQIMTAGGNTIICLPSAKNLFEQPTPRWYRPWSPHIVIYNAGRSYRFGYDGQYDAQGYLKCRTSGESVYSLAVSNSATVIGSDLLLSPNSITSKTGLPAETESLLEESLLLDAESGPCMAALSVKEGKDASANLFRSAVYTLWMSRSSKLVDPTLTAKVNAQGKQPSAIAITPWQDSFDPLFLDANYSHPHSSLETDWALQEDEVEFVALSMAATNPPDAQVEVITERSRLTATIAETLKSRMVTRQTLNPMGHLVLAQKAPTGLTTALFDNLNAISAPLVQIDGTLFARGYRQRTGALRINSVDVVDVFGTRRQWSSGVNPTSADGGPQDPWWTPLPPRLPYWGRLWFRLQSAADPGIEASAIAPPVCGLLLPDFLEHALEVFDGQGKAIGILSNDRPPQAGSTAAVTLNVNFEVYPWVAAEKKMAAGADPLDAIANPVLRSVVAGIAMQKLYVPAGQSVDNWFETGLTALLRVVDTVRGTIDPSVNTADRKLQLLGEPILVLGMRISFQSTNVPKAAGLAVQDPPSIATPPPMPVIPVRIGDITRPDDGVLGCFLPGATPADSHFAPVSTTAATNAVLNGLTENLPSSYTNGKAVSHPFIQGQTNLYQVPENGQSDVIVLADIRGAIYATCGVLPRKKIIIPREFVDPALQNMEPAFAVGPLLAVSQDGGTLKPYLPPPNVDGYKDQFVYRQRGDTDTYPSPDIVQGAATGELPAVRTLLSEGWVRLVKPQKQS